jgi:Peptidase family C25
MKLDDSIALAFIRAGSLNYVGYSSLSYIHVSEDHHKRFYQALVYENATMGQAVKDADNLYSMKLKGAQSLKDMEDYEEMLPNGWPSAESMMNETLSISTLFGDPCFRPSVPRTPPLPYTEVVTQTKSSEGSPAAGFASASLAANSTTLKPAVSSTANSTVVKSSVTNRSASNVTVKPAVNAMVSPAVNVTINVTAKATVNSTAGPAIRPVAATAANEGASYAKAELEASITPRNEMATDWVYWMQTEVSDGKLLLNSPAALIGEVVIPKDAEKVVVKEDGQAVFHDEEIMAQGKKVIWPVIRPKVNETRTFTVEYEVVPGETQIIRITPGWSAISLYLNPKDTSVSKYFSSKPYRGIFTVVGQDWSFTTEDNGMSNVTRLEAGRGYVVDSSGNFTIEVSGKPVELPYRLSLVKGWNLIGVPYNRTVSINSVIVSAEHKRYSYPQAAAKGYVSTFLWKYDGSSWAQVSGNETLEPGKGYLLEAKDDCKLEFRK